MQRVIRSYHTLAPRPVVQGRRLHIHRRRAVGGPFQCYVVYCRRCCLPHPFPRRAETAVWQSCSHSSAPRRTSSTREHRHHCPRRELSRRCLVYRRTIPSHPSIYLCETVGVLEVKNSRVRTSARRNTGLHIRNQENS